MLIDGCFGGLEPLLHSAWVETQASGIGLGHSAEYARPSLEGRAFFLFIRISPVWTKLQSAVGLCDRHLAIPCIFNRLTTVDTLNIHPSFAAEMGNLHGLLSRLRRL